MRRVLKYFVSAVLAAVLVGVSLPPQAVHAAVHVQSVDLSPNTSYLIGGQSYNADVHTDKAVGTVIKSGVAEYSVDNGATWIGLRTFWLGNNSDSTVHLSFTIPFDQGLTSLVLRYRFHFSPIFGDDSHPVYTSRAYTVLQPGQPSDLTATSNNDGTVTLQWYDNTNMESYYQVIRDGPDNSKIFIARNTADAFGWVTFTDKETNTSKSTVYGYTITPFIDKYEVPLELRPGSVNTVVKTKVPIKIIEKQTLPDIHISDILKPDPINVKIINPDKWGVLLPDVDKVQVSSVTLDKKDAALKVGESIQLNAAVVPSNAGNKNVTWSSNDNKVAVVDSTGKVTAVAAGSAKITVKTEAGGFTAICLVTVAAEETPPPPPPPSDAGLTDIAGHWAEKEIIAAVEQGLVSGYPDGSFKPDRTVTRAEFAAMLVNALKPTIFGKELTFRDSDSIGAWALTAVAQCVDLGIISGYPDGTFKPNKTINHAEMISVVVRAANLPMTDGETTDYADDDQIPAWAKSAAATAKLYSIPTYITDNLFKPNDLATRAEAVTSILNMLKVKK